MLCFREMSQLPSETMEQFVTRLRQKAQYCKFGDAAAVDEQIRERENLDSSSFQDVVKALEN